MTLDCQAPVLNEAKLLESLKSGTKVIPYSQPISLISVTYYVIQAMTQFLEHPSDQLES